MKRFTMILTVLGVAVTTAAIASQSQSQATEEGFFAGIVLGVDPRDGTLYVEEASLDAEKMRFTIGRDASLVKDQKPIQLSDIQVGDPVSIEYETRGFENVARHVKVITSPSS